MKIAVCDKEAVKWFRKAAEQGDAIAQFALGFMYYKGKGVEPDNGKAYRWFLLAANNGDKMAEEYKNRIFSEMTK